MKNKWRLLPAICMFVIGTALLLYPLVSDYWNYCHQSRAAAGYNAMVAGRGKDSYEQLFEEAREYNTSLPGKVNRFYMGSEERAYYNSLLSAGGSEVMAVLEIPAIGLYLPVYHGTSEEALQAGIGHLEGSSLPVGGEGTHCVLSGHRGLPSSRLFTDLDRLGIGDEFYIHVLGRILAYRIDQILVVEPDETDALGIAREGDFCTLLTCTPYGINTHRLLVRGSRDAAGEETIGAQSGWDAAQEPVSYAFRPQKREVLALIPLALIWILAVVCFLKRKKETKKERQ